MPNTVDSWLEEASSHTVTERICFDRALVGELEDLQRQLADESKGLLQSPPELAERVEALKASVAEKTREFIFGSIGRTAWRELLSENPPTEEQLESIGRGLDHNPEEFPYAAMAASCQEPGLTVAQAKKLSDVLPTGVFDRVWAACLAANIVGGDEKKAVGTSVVLPSVKK
jgi:hypothetical protein